jgi:crotonobetainyl-CoA:carnitine CoA-transferase CaiB-like acyl-CoA transferase
MKKEAVLKDIRVLDFTHVLAGPFGSMLLGDLGADIIKVEHPIRGKMTREIGHPVQNGFSGNFLSVNRNKKSICVDLKKSEGVAVIKRIVKNCDALMENFRPGVMDRFGLGYDEMIRIKPDLVYSSLSAFGRESPYRHKPGYELIVQGLAGLIHLNSPPEGPPAKIQVQLVDLCTGMFLSYATLGALYHKLNTGEGQRVETSLLESSLAMMANLAHIFFMTGDIPTGMGTRHPAAMPSQAFRTIDTYFVTVGPWDRFCRALGKPEWIEDPNLGDFAYRIQHYDDMVEMIEAITTTKTTKEWLEILEEHDMAAGPINSVIEAFQDPGVQATGMVKSIEHPAAGELQMLNNPWHMSATASDVINPPPVLGQDTEEVLLSHGFKSEEIDNHIKGTSFIAK